MFYVIKTFLLAVCLLALGSHASAASAPVIDQLDAVLLDGKVHVTLNWRSEAPVTEINISGGKDVQVVKEKITTFRTSMGGYKGRHSQIVDSNYVVFQKAYRTEHYSSQYLRQGNSVVASTDAGRTVEPIQEVIVVTVWLTDKYGNVSERKEQRISKTIEAAPSPVPVQVQLSQPATGTVAAQPVTLSGLVVGAAGAVADVMNKPRVSFHSVSLSADGTIVVTATAVSTNNITQFASTLVDKTTNVVKQEVPFGCSAPRCENRSISFPGVSPGTYWVKIKAIDATNQEANGTYNSLVTVPAVNTAPAPSQPSTNNAPAADMSGLLQP